MFTDESRFILQSDSRRTFIWRAPGTRYHQENIIERHRYGGAGVLFFGGIILCSRTNLHVQIGTMTSQIYRDVILEQYVRLFRGAMGAQFVFMDDNARPHRANIVSECLQSEDITRMEWPAFSPDLNPVEHVWDMLGRRVAVRQPRPACLPELRRALLFEWCNIPQDPIDNLILGMPRRCTDCIASSGRHTIRLLQCGLRARTPLYRIPLTHDHRRLRLQWANQHRDWRADWQHVVFSDESRFNLWYHDGRIRVRRYAGERHLPECIIERHSGRTPGVMVWGAIAYHRRSQLLRIVGNLNSNRYIREVLQPEAVPFLQSLPGAVFQQDNARPHTARIVKSFFAAQQVQLLPWPVCSPDMSPIEHVWDVSGRRLARDPRPVASADELWVRVQTIWNALPQSDIQTLFDSMPRRVAALIAARGGHTKY
ncbi:Transposable element Tcb1 transposase, partial [Stegodyphus mimosarum]